MTCTAAALAAFDLIPTVSVREVVDFGVAFDSHVVLFEIVQEAIDYRGNVRCANDDEADFGDQCYYNDRANDNLARLRELGAHAMAYALCH